MSRDGRCEFLPECERRPVVLARITGRLDTLHVCGRCFGGLLSASRVEKVTR